MRSGLIRGFKENITTRWWSTNNQDIFVCRFTKKFTNFCCKYMPKPARKIFFSAIDSIGILTSRFFFLFSQLFLTIYLLEGKEKYSKKNISILLISSKEKFAYLSKKIFSEPPKIQKIGKTNLLNLNKKIQSTQLNFDGVFIKNDLFYSRFLTKKGFTIIPERISMTLDISPSIEKIYKNFSKSGKEDIRKVKKNKYSYEITNDSDKLDLFYNKMYLPYTSQRHKETAICANYYTIRHLFERKNKLMLIKQDNEYVYGSLFFTKNDEVIATYAGLMQGREDLLQNGVSAAAYYFLIKWAKDNKIKYADFGTCRSFLNNGVFRYKKKWGTQIKKTDSMKSPEVFAFKQISNNSGIVSFLKNNPFIFLEEGKLKINVFDEKDSEEFDYYIKNNNNSALSKLVKFPAKKL